MLSIIKRDNVATKNTASVQWLSIKYQWNKLYTGVHCGIDNSDKFVQS